jgi:DNA invertase Pin-like site-specific DNA recombinase
MTAPCTDGRKRVLLVGRVSRGERQQDPESQLCPLRVVASRRGWEVQKELSLRMSAWDPTSAAEVLRQVLEPVREGKVDVVAVWALDRIYRGDVPGAFRLLDELELHLGAEFYSLQESFLCSGADQEQRELMLALRSWAARWDSNRKSERLRAKVESKRNRAEAGGGRARWGRGVLPTSSDQVAVHRLSAEGLTQREIAARLAFSPSTVNRLLRRPPELGVSPLAEKQRDPSPETGGRRAGED